MSIAWIACPKDWRCAIDAVTVRCVKHDLKAKRLTKAEQQKIRKEYAETEVS